MAKVVNTGKQPRGFWDTGMNNIVVPPGEEREFNMTEEDYAFNEQLLEDDESEPPLFELSGGAESVASQKGKKARERVKPEKVKATGE